MTSGLETEQALFYSSQGPHGGKTTKQLMKYEYEWQTKLPTQLTLSSTH